jgi:hypothetical protein
MALALTTTFGVILWVVLWALGVKGFDGFLLTILIVLLGATVKSLGQFLPGRER